MIFSRRHKSQLPAVTPEQLAAGGTLILALAATALALKLLRSRTQAAVLSGFHLRMDKSLADEVRRVARNEIDGAIASLSTNGSPIPVEGVHDARKRIKRLRALLRLTRHEVGKKVFSAENEALRTTARRLSAARDSDVMVQTLDSITKAYGEEIPPGTFEQLRAVLVHKAATERELLALHAGAVRGAIAELHSLRARVAGWPLPIDGRPTDLKEGVRYVYTRAREASDAAYERPSSGRLHRLRRRNKDVVHTAELLDHASPRAARIANRGKAISQMLGDEHDLAVLRAGAAEYSATLSPDDLVLLEALIDRRRAEISRDATEQASLFYNRPPGRMIRRFIASD